MIDNRYVEGSSTPIIRRDRFGNTYQERVLRDGTRHEVLRVKRLTRGDHDYFRTEGES